MIENDRSSVATFIFCQGAGIRPAPAGWPSIDLDFSCPHRQKPYYDINITCLPLVSPVFLGAVTAICTDRLSDRREGQGLDPLRNQSL